MSKILSLLTCSFILSLASFAQKESGSTFLLFYLGGQSNMDGFGYSNQLPDSLKEDFEDVWIFHGNPAPDGDATGGLGVWSRLRPGHGTGFASDGNINIYSDRFGIELALAASLSNRYPDYPIALIKYSRGGTSIDSLATGNFGNWEPDWQQLNGINQYDHFLKTMQGALTTQDINRDGKPDKLIPMGICWMQGESDGAFNETIADRYYSNLKRLMDLIRAAMHRDDLPVVIGKISDSWNADDGKVWDYGELIQYAQEKYARTDPAAAIIRDTRYYKYSDPWHYDSEGYIRLGIRFAEELIKLNQ